MWLITRLQVSDTGSLSDKIFTSCNAFPSDGLPSTSMAIKRQTRPFNSVLIGNMESHQNQCTYFCYLTIHVNFIVAQLNWWKWQNLLRWWNIHWHRIKKIESNILWTRKCESNKERLSQKVAKWPKGKMAGLGKLKEPHTEQGFDIGVQVHMPLLSLPPSLKRVDKSYPKQWNLLPDDRAIECQK